MIPSRERSIRATLLISHRFVVVFPRVVSLISIPLSPGIARVSYHAGAGSRCEGATRAP
jgi:hypothetical protein